MAVPFATSAPKETRWPAADVRSSIAASSTLASEPTTRQCQHRRQRRRPDGDCRQAGGHQQDERRRRRKHLCHSEPELVRRGTGAGDSVLELQDWSSTRTAR